MTHRSIAQRMGKARSLGVRRGIALEWSADWRAEHDELLRELERRLGAGNIADAGQMVGKLKAMHAKRFEGLVRVIEDLASDDAV